MRYKTAYCHIMNGNTREKKSSVKLEIIRYAQMHGNKPAARKYDCSKNTIKLWRYRYEENGMSGLSDQRKGPKHIPHKTSKAEEEKIIAFRKKAPCYGPKRLKWAYDIKASTGAIARILKTNGMVNKRRKKYQRKQDLREAKARAYQALTHHQQDVKHLYDIPYYWEQLITKGLPKYQVTIRDTKSGFMLLGFGDEYSENYCTLMMEYYLTHLKRMGIDLEKVIIQTDNGSEFGARKKDIKQPGFVNTIVHEYGARHQYIPPGMSNANADVESVHAAIENEFFDIENFKNRDDFFIKAEAYQLFYNHVRLNYSKGGKPPMQIINEEHKEVNGKIAFFPVLDLDKEFAMRENSGSGVKKDICIGGQTLHKLPEYSPLRFGAVVNIIYALFAATVAKTAPFAAKKAPANPTGFIVTRELTASCTLKAPKASASPVFICL